MYRKLGVVFVTA